MTIADGQVVLIHYTLTDPEGEVLDSSSGGPPVPYLHGAGNLVPGLERALEGRAVGDTFEVEVPAKDGYGERGSGEFRVPRDQFPPGPEIEEGMEIIMEDDEGRHVPLWVVEATDEHVLLDPNHPLAGIDLHFAIEIVSQRDATDDERAHGHPHGPDGTEHHHH